MQTFRVNYQYASSAGALRAGAIVVQADNGEQAKELALAKVPTAHMWPKITTVSLYTNLPIPVLSDTKKK